MINLFNQSTGRTSLTKIKGLILGSVIALVSAVPCPVFAQISGFGITSSSTVDNSPASWTLNVVFPLGNVVFFQDLNVTTTAGFPPFNVYVSNSSSTLSVSFNQNGSLANFYLDPSGLSAGTTTLVPRVGGNVTTVAGFANDAVVTATRSPGANSSVTVVVWFSNNTANPPQLISALNGFVGALGLPPGVQNSLQGLLSGNNSSNPTAACNQLNAFINHVNQKTPPLTSAQALQLITAAIQIQAALGCL